MPMGLLSWKLFVDSCRLLSVCSFLICSLTFNWYSFASLIFLLGSLYLLDRDQYNAKDSVDIVENPYKNHRKIKSADLLPAEVKMKYFNKLEEFLLYDAENCKVLEHFKPIKMNTHCSFARTSKLWGARDYNPDLTLEANVEKSIPALIKLLITGDSFHLDGFVFEVPSEFCSDVKRFSEGVRRVLKCLSDHDPNKYHCMNRSTIAGLGWCFEFCSIPLFVTTFASCYPSNHSRFSFGATNGFILLQPMYSFAIHDIGSDTPITNWDNPITVRDKIRVAYKANGRPYYIRETIRYPMAHDIVKPMVEGPSNVLKWWIENEVSCEDELVDEKELTTKSSNTLMGHHVESEENELVRKRHIAEKTDEL